MGGSTADNPHFLAGPFAGPWPRPLGDYLLEAELGTGGMGMVFRGRHRQRPGAVAIKVLTQIPGAEAKAVSRFRKEITNLARLRHPSICRLLDFGHCDGVEFLVMDLVEGVDLVTWCRSVPAERWATVFAAVAAAVGHAHDQGIVHRDLTPNNILVTDGDHPVVMDFGLSRDFESGELVTLTRSVAGTPAYMAPEQTRGDRRAHEPPADVWGLGATFYHALVGQPPFSGDTVHEIFSAINQREPNWPGGLPAALPPTMARIVRRCLQKEPSDRYADSAALARDLNLLAQGRAVRVRLPGLARRTWRRLRRRPILTLLAAAILVAVSLVAGLLALDHYRRWADWIEVVRLDPQRTPDSPLASRFFGLSGEHLPITGPAEVPGYDHEDPSWLWLKAPGLAGPARFQLDLEVVDPSQPGSVEVVFAAYSEASQRTWSMPRGRAVKLRYNPENSELSWGTRFLERPGLVPNQRNRRLPLLRQVGDEVSLVLTRRGDAIALSVDGVESGGFPALDTTRTGEQALAFRLLAEGWRWRQLRVHRLALAEQTNVLTAAEALAEAGLPEAALSAYRATAADHAGSTIGALALARAIAIAADRPNPDLVALQTMVSTMRERHPSSFHCRRSEEVLATALWRQGRIDVALDQVADLLAADATTMVVADLLESEPFRIEPRQAQRLIELAVASQDLSDVSLAGLPLASLEAARGARWRRLDCSHTGLSDLGPVATMPNLTILRASGNLISDLSPLRGRSFEKLVLDNNQIQDPAALAQITVTDSLALGGNPLQALPRLPLVPRSVVLTATGISDLAPLGGPRLRHLSLDGTPVRNLAPLAQCTGLQSLSLGQNPIEDLSPLAKLPLNWLQVAGHRAGGSQNLGFFRGFRLELGGMRLAPLAGWLSKSVRELTLIDCDPVDLSGLQDHGLLELTAENTRLGRLDDLPAGLLRLTHVGAPLPWIDPPGAGHPFVGFGLPGRAAQVEVFSDLDALSSDDLERLATACFAAGRDDHGRGAQAVAFHRQGQPELLRHLAIPIAGRLYTLLPVRMTPDQATDLAARVGAHLAFVPDAGTAAALAAHTAWTRMAFIGFRRINGSGRWDGGHRSVYRGNHRLEHWHLDYLEGWPWSLSQDSQIYLNRSNKGVWLMWDDEE